MRLDKWIKVSRLIKRRTIANEACDKGCVFVNGKVARASYELKAGDVVELKLARELKVRVLQVTEFANKSNAGELFEIIED